MADNRKYCPGCMEAIEDGVNVCPHCFYNIDTENNAPALNAGTIVSGRYLIGKLICLAHDSITYLGRDLYSDTVLSISEFFPSKILSRESGETTITVKLGYDTMFENCRESFLSLWRGLDMFKADPCLPKVQDIIESNGTVYAISEYLDSITLKAFFEETKKPLPWARAHSAFKPILSCIQKLHSAGIMHGSISPNTVHVGSDGKLHLTGFSIPQCYSSVEELRARPVQGFSAIELYGENPALNTCSDVYSVMALLYYSITGLVPPVATKRAVKDTMVLPAAVASTLSSKVIDCFVRSLSVYPQNRISTIEEVIGNLAPISAPRNAAPVQTQSQQDSPEAQYESEEYDEPYTEKNEPDSPTKKGSSTSLVTLALTTFFAAVIICSILFCVLYSTVLYKSIEVPFLDNILGSVSFLPMNQQVTDVYVPEADTTTTQAPAAPEKSYVTVPNFKSHTRDSILTNENFNERFNIIFTEDYSDEVPKDSIIKQSIDKGESVLSGTTITVVVSLGEKPIELPNVIGMQYSKAKKELEDRGFTVTKEVMENKGGNKENEVYLMDKVAGLEFQKGTEIVLSIWGEEPTTEETTTKKDKDKDKDNDKKKEEGTTKKKEESTTKKKEPSTKETTTKKKEETTKPTTTKKQESTTKAAAN